VATGLDQANDFVPEFSHPGNGPGFQHPDDSIFRSLTNHRITNASNLRFITHYPVNTNAFITGLGPVLYGSL
jgi:hypothetical protein